MKPFVFSLFAASSLLAQTPGSHPAWQEVLTVDVPSAGLVRFAVPPETIQASQSHLEDVRLVGPGGQESPWVAEWPLFESMQSLPAAAFQASLQDKHTVLQIATGTDKPVRAVTVQTSAASFIKAATVEGSNDGSQWQPLVGNDILFHQADGTHHLRLPFAPGVWKQLRITINDERADAVAFTGASVETGEASTEAIPQPTAISKRNESLGQSRVTISLGASNLWIASLKIVTPEPVFSRRVQVLVGDRVIASQTVFRLALDGHETSELEIPVQAQITAPEVVLSIDNGDSPPLKMEAVEAQRYPVTVAFHAEAAGQWQLFTGNAGAAAPHYDMAAVTAQLRNASAITAKVSPLVPNPAFNKSAALPETGTAGAAIDLRGWSYRKTLVAKDRGVVTLDLDLEALAHASSDFSDVRVVQDGHQLPFILQSTSASQQVPVTVTESPDTHRPSVSLWQLKLPFRSLPLVSLSATSPTPLFDRSLSLLEARRDGSGDASQSWLGTAAWSQKPGDAQALDLPVRSRPEGDILILETDNGDNAALQLDHVTAACPVVHLLFKTTDPAPVYLYYGNNAVSTPQYDLRLVQQALKAATPVPASLGEEEKLKPTPPNEETPGKGSPWLWAALALVVGGLLWVVAKLLPATVVE